MIKPLLVCALVLAAGGAAAEVFMCKNASGETEFSDKPCRAGSSSEVVPDRAPLTQQQKNEAEQKVLQQKNKVAELEQQRAAEQGKPDDTQATPPSTDLVEDEKTSTTCNDDRKLNSNCAKTLNEVERNRKIMKR